MVPWELKRLNGEAGFFGGLDESDATVLHRDLHHTETQPGNLIDYDLAPRIDGFRIGWDSVGVWLMEFFREWF